MRSQNKRQKSLLSDPRETLRDGFIKSTETASELMQKTSETAHGILEEATIVIGNLTDKGAVIAESGIETVSNWVKPTSYTVRTARKARTQSARRPTTKGTARAAKRT